MARQSATVGGSNIGNVGTAIPPLSTGKRWLYGGLGSLAPIIVAGLSLDFTAVFSSLSLLVFLGWLCRTILLFLVGGFVVYLHRQENDEWRAFLIGISAPALITTILAGRPGAQPPTPTHSQTKLEMPRQKTYAQERLFGYSEGKPHVHDAKWIVLVDTEQRFPVESLCIPRESAANQFLRGFAGNDQNSYWVISAPFSTMQSAQEFAASLYAGTRQDDSAIWRQWRPTIVKLPDGTFSVVVAAGLDRKQAWPYIDLPHRNPELFYRIRVLSLGELAYSVGKDAFDLPTCPEFPFG